MYELISVTFDRHFGNFDWASEAVDEAKFAGLPGEEFVVTRDGEVVATFTAASDPSRMARF